MCHRLIAFAVSDDQAMIVIAAKNQAGQRFPVVGDDGPKRGDEIIAVIA
jgi:hypothetical protein